ncbi:MAG: M48 family metallopeptidase [Candidatus Omnitrophota bacterium]
MEVTITRSRRRRRTVSARLVNDTLFVSAPLLISEPALMKVIDNFKARFQRKKFKDELNKKAGLGEVARSLNEKYFDSKLKINKIEYVTNQSAKFGCCDYKNGHIRISHKLSTMPSWVRDYVVFHEMAHLLEPHHKKPFWDIVLRYPLAERARGYLIAVGLEKQEGEESDCEGGL